MDTGITPETLAEDYETLGSLRAVADKYKMSYESVRQILRKSGFSTERSTFDITEDEFVKDIKEYGSVFKAAKARDVSRFAYAKALQNHGLVGEEKRQRIREIKKEKAVEDYLKLCEERGEEVTSYWLYANDRGLISLLSRNFGGFKGFRAWLEEERASA